VATEKIVHHPAILTMKTHATPKTATVKKGIAGGKKPSVQNPPANTTVATEKNGQKPTTNSRPTTEEIAARAYKIWQQQGCPEGREEQHWWQAEQEIIRDGSNTSIPQS
jgi:hypothetical protein